ncbi:MAG: hypothetical protein NT079_04125 [Candidatus Omnitrophica bacterium]|nr:hypothetical protein [Candidatus Omnitrophota bacterium]
MKFKNGQSIAEYVIVAGLIAVALAAMGPGFRRSVQKVVKSAADSIGFQVGSEQAANVDAGFVNYMTSNAQGVGSGTISVLVGNYKSVDNQQVNTQSATDTNGTFVPY